MLVHLKEHVCIVERTEGDPRFRNGGWGSGESRLLYHVKRELNKLGYGFVKRRLQSDGHMMGDEATQYLRQRLDRPGPLAIFDPDWAARNLAEDFNREGRVELMVTRL